jgi:hypothetical protein
MKIDMAGKAFGSLEVIREIPGVKPAKWLCLCRLCGAESFRYGHHLRKTGTAYCTSCQHVSKTHGQDGTKVYYARASMKRRCQDPNHPAFKNYGGRGIKVCKRWDSFENFFKDMGEPPPGKSLDRYPDNDGNYEPGNCRWAGREEQARNQRRSFPPILVNGRAVSVKDAALILGVTPTTIRNRFRRGVSEYEIRVQQLGD